MLQNYECLISFTIISIRNHLASIFISRTVVQILLQRDLIMLTTKATIAASRITGPANMKTGIAPEVRVTNSVFYVCGCKDIADILQSGCKLQKVGDR